MEVHDQAARVLVRRRRDNSFFESMDACSGKWGEDKTECLCEHGEEFWCDDTDRQWHSHLNIGGIIAVVIVALLILTCILCMCRRRRRGFVFRTPSGR